ncbi:MAG TPA: YIP1 family protein, partial [Thermomicrobiales bacterium]|nr:YIP1 family protein [Thermomicrobiales bacterium]
MSGRGADVAGVKTMYATSPSLVDRMIGAARLDPNTYENVEHDTSATGQAATVVIVAAIAAGIGSLGGPRPYGLGNFIWGVISALVGWVIFAALVYFVGTKLLPSATTSSTLGEVMRTLGFAETPAILAVFGFIPGIGGLIAFIASIWVLVTAIVAIRQSLEVTTGRAIAIGIIAFLIPLIILT